jgi:hypothetical protein
MIDYVEGLLDIKKTLKDIEDAILKQRIREARLLLSDLRHLAGETDSQLVRQFDQA